MDHPPAQIVRAPDDAVVWRQVAVAVGAEYGGMWNEPQLCSPERGGCGEQWGQVGSPLLAFEAESGTEWARFWFDLSFTPTLYFWEGDIGFPLVAQSDLALVMGNSRVRGGVFFGGSLFFGAQAGGLIICQPWRGLGVEARVTAYAEPAWTGSLGLHFGANLAQHRVRAPRPPHPPRPPPGIPPGKGHWETGPDGRDHWIPAGARAPDSPEDRASTGAG